MNESKHFFTTCQSTILAIRTVPVSVSSTFGTHDNVSTVNATVGGWPSGSDDRLSPKLSSKVLSAKQEISRMKLAVISISDLI